MFIRLKDINVVLRVEMDTSIIKTKFNGSNLHHWIHKRPKEGIFTVNKS